MRSAQLFRNDNALRFLRPYWDSSRYQKFGSSLRRKKQDESDPYEGNYNFVECDQFTKVTVIGAAGRVGKTLSLLLKTCPFIDHLCLFDTDKSVKGVGVDISHIDTKCCVSYVCGMRNIQQALNAPDVVIIAAGCPASPNVFGRKLFEKNAPIVAGLSEACARFCPKACVVLITSPINSLLPVMGEVFQIITNRIPSRKMFGLTTLDVVRANTFVAEVIRKDPNSVIVPVIGGTSQDTLVPVISQMKPCCKIKRGEMIALTECLKRAEENLTDCQNCGTRGASTLSTAYAGFRFTSSLVMALKGAENIIECAFVKSDVIPELEYLASPLKLGMHGIEHNFGYPPLSDYELAGFEKSAAVLISDIRMGKAFVNGIEDTIQKGLIWKRLSEGNLKAFEDGKYYQQKESAKPQEANKTESNSFSKSVLNQIRSEKTVEEVKEPVVQPTMLTHEVYSENVRNWASQSPLNRLFCSGEVQGNEITTDSISADLDSGSCREDQSLHGEKHLEELLEEKKPNEERENQSKATRLLGAFNQYTNYLRPSLLQTVCRCVQLGREYHTMQKDKVGFSEPKVKKKPKMDEYKRYLMEDRLKMLLPVKQPTSPINSVMKVRVKNVQSSPKISFRNVKVQNDRYKSLNATAKQKYRNFNVQKKFTPSASALFLLDQKKKERTFRNIGCTMTTIRKKCDEDDEEIKYENKNDDEEDEKEEIVKNLLNRKEPKNEHQELIVRTEKDEITKYKDFIFQQLRQLKRENEELKRRIMQLSEDRNVGSALQAQSETLELEKTKLKACWLIMSSTMDAFGNFCKKFTSKSDEQLLEDAKELDKKQQEEQDEQESEEEYEDALETQDRPEEKKSVKYDDKYFKFLEKLMEDQMGNRMEKEKNRSRMKK